MIGPIAGVGGWRGHCQTNRPCKQTYFAGAAPATLHTLATFCCSSFGRYRVHSIIRSSQRAPFLWVELCGVSCTLRNPLLFWTYSLSDIKSHFIDTRISIFYICIYVYIYTTIYILYIGGWGSECASTPSPNGHMLLLNTMGSNRQLLDKSFPPTTVKRICPSFWFPCTATQKRKPLHVFPGCQQEKPSGLSCCHQIENMPANR